MFASSSFDMKSIVKTLCVFLLLLFFIGFPRQIFASNYGDGIYGSGDYGIGSTPTPSAPSTQSISNTIAAFFCTKPAPLSPPSLFEIDTTDIVATLFFVPAVAPVDSYTISFGQGKNNEGYGISFAQGNATGAIMYKINDLSPNSVYTFKVRGSNGCKPGDWSSTITIKTQPKGSKNLRKFYLGRKSMSIIVQKPSEQKTSVQSSPAPSRQPIQRQTIKTEKQTTQPSVFESLVHFFTQWFK